MKIVCEWTEGGAPAAGTISTNAWRSSNTLSSSKHLWKWLEELKVFEKVHRGGVKSAGEQKQGMSDGEGPDHAGEGFGLC